VVQLLVVAVPVLEALVPALVVQLPRAALVPKVVWAR
jgi:hypothetical protein